MVYRGYVVQAFDSIFDRFHWLHHTVHVLAKLEKHVEVLVLVIFSYLLANNVTAAGLGGTAEKNAFVLAVAGTIVALYDLLAKIGESAMNNYCLDRIADGHEVILNTMIYEQGVKIMVGVLNIFLGWRARVGSKSSCFSMVFAVPVYLLAGILGLANLVLSFLGGGNPAVFIIASVELYAVRSESKGNPKARMTLNIISLVLTVLAFIYRPVAEKVYVTTGGIKRRDDMDEEYIKRRKFVGNALYKCIPLDYSSAVRQKLNSESGKCSSHHGDDISVKLRLTEGSQSYYYGVDLVQNDTILQEEDVGPIDHSAGKLFCGEDPISQTTMEGRAV